MDELILTQSKMIDNNQFHTAREQMIIKMQKQRTSTLVYLYLSKCIEDDISPSQCIERYEILDNVDEKIHEANNLAAYLTMRCQTKLQPRQKKNKIEIRPEDYEWIKRELMIELAKKFDLLI